MNIPNHSIALISAVVALSATTQAIADPLKLDVYHADNNSFNVNAVLITGKHDAVLVDTGFTKADALRITAMVLDSHKTLKTIYISQADPDFYFGIDVLKEHFPDAQVVATSSTVEKIEQTLPTKLNFWPAKMGGNAPEHVTLPNALESNEFELEGHKLEIRGMNDSLPHRSYVWIPSIKAVVGGANVFAGLHVWTADADSAEERAVWSQKLAEIKLLQPEIVIPGHSASGTKQDLTQVDFTQQYLEKWDEELKHAKDSATLIKAMQSAYPDAGLGIALDIGAKVATGEMKW